MCGALWPCTGHCQAWPSHRKWAVLRTVLRRAPGGAPDEHRPMLWAFLPIAALLTVTPGPATATVVRRIVLKVVGGLTLIYLGLRSVFGEGRLAEVGPRRRPRSGTGSLPGLPIPSSQSSSLPSSL